MADPITEAFQKIIQEIYWIEDLEEAERILAEHLEMIDDDLREVLLERRRKICSDPLRVIELAHIEALIQSTDDTLTSKILMTKSMVESTLLLQCTKSWSKLTPREKARILAPLYKASYGLELALRGWPKHIDEILLDNALQMAATAWERAEEKGLVNELEEFLEKLMENVEGGRT